MKRIFLSTALVGLVTALPAASATITGWDTSNVLVGSTPADYVTGESVVYDQVLSSGGSVPTTATTNGKIVFTPPEAVSPGIVVSNVPYPDSGTGSPPAMLDGCIKTSSAAACDDEFQSGKRIKKTMTSTAGPVDLVFNIDPTDTALKTYQVFDRIINATGAALSGFQLSLGFGIGSDFVEAVTGGGLSFSTTFTAQPSGTGSSGTQFPFGLFGDASTNPNFLLDGFFDDVRTGLNVLQGATTIASTDFFGNYETLFGSWLNNDVAALPSGLFWDFDNDVNTDALLMAWQRDDGLWELRRDAGQTCATNDSGITTCTEGVTRDTYLVGTYDEVVAALNVSDPIFVDAIEDLANLNINYAIALGDLTGVGFGQTPTSFTLRTMVFPTQVAAVPLPAGAPLLLLGLGMIGFMGRRRGSLANQC